MKLSDKEVLARKNAEYSHKTFKRKFPDLWGSERDNMVRGLLATSLPEWGSVRLSVTRAGL